MRPSDITVPRTIVAGYSYTVKASVGDYDPALDQLSFTMHDGATAYTFSSTLAPAEQFIIDLSDTATIALLNGRHLAQISITVNAGTDQAQQFHLLNKTIEVSANALSGDTRSHVKKTLDNLEAVLEGKASSDVKAYTIAGRSLEKMPIVELIQWRDKYRAEYRDELRREAIKSGGQGVNAFQVRFR